MDRVNYYPGMPAASADANVVQSLAEAHLRDIASAIGAAVTTGAEVTAGPGVAATVSAGRAIGPGGERIVVAGGPVALANPPTGQQQWAAITARHATVADGAAYTDKLGNPVRQYARDAATLQAIYGAAAAADPDKPTVPATDVILADVLLPALTVDIARRATLGRDLEALRRSALPLATYTLTLRGAAWSWPLVPGVQRIEILTSAGSVTIGPEREHLATFHDEQLSIVRDRGRTAVVATIDSAVTLPAGTRSLAPATAGFAFIAAGDEAIYSANLQTGGIATGASLPTGATVAGLAASATTLYASADAPSPGAIYSWPITRVLAGLHPIPGARSKVMDLASASPAAQALAYGNNTLYYGDSGGVRVVDTAAGTLGSPIATPGTVEALAYGDGSLWATVGGDLLKINPATGSSSRAGPAPAGGLASLRPWWPIVFPGTSVPWIFASRDDDYVYLGPGDLDADVVIRMFA